MKKNNFKDVAIVPKSTKVSSREQVNLIQNIKGLKTNGVIVANMDTTGTFAMAKRICPEGFCVALHKYYDYNQLFNFFNTLTDEVLDRTFVTIGTSYDEFTNLLRLSKEFEIKNICLDVANGYMKIFLNKIKTVREFFPKTLIMAGNVCTPEGCVNILNAGADIVKVGLAGGCFTGDTLVQTISGKKPIKNIKVFEKVLTHTGEFKEVSATKNRIEKERIFDINGIKCTKNHKFYVVDRKLKNEINQNNIHLLAKWVSAEDLNDNYLLIKITEHTN